MDGEQKFWFCTWSLVAGVAATLIICVATVSHTKAEKLAAMVAAGVDPVRAHCGVYGPGEGAQAMCALAGNGK